MHVVFVTLFKLKMKVTINNSLKDHINDKGK